MKNKILKFLMDNTNIENRYIGGGEEISIIVLKNSEDCSKESYLSEFADALLTELENTNHNK